VTRTTFVDRDGTLNAEVGFVSRPEQLQVLPAVPAALQRLCTAGFGLVVASNQPAAAKGKTTRAELDEVHRLIVAAAESAGGVILSSHVCFHRAEDGCLCRKPRTGLLEEAFARHAGYAPAASWMVGDRATDVLAGAALGLRTALLGVADSADDALLVQHQVQPFYRGIDLRDFVEYLLETK